ncbi:MAG: glycine oxidase ThiO [Acidobacteriota bacterium]|nr:glycine oxidase ThiO [Acidobacteriota bacterium]
MNLSKNQDILIVGGGIIGLATARELRKKGVERITLLEKNSACGMEASSAAAGMLAPQAEADEADDFFEFCQASRDLFPNFAKQLFDETGVDIELDQTGTLYLAFTDEDAEELEKRFVWQKEVNLKVEKLSAKEVLEIEPNVSKNVLFGLRFPTDWQVENQKIVEAFNKQLTGIALNKFMQRNSMDKVRARNGAEFVSREVRSLIFENNKVIGVETDIEKFYAPIIIIASGAWTSLIRDKFNLLSNIEIKPIRGQMLAFNDNHKLFRHVIYSPRGYLVPRKNCRILVGATVEDVGFDNRTTDLGTVSLLNIAFEIAPEIRNLSLKKTWAGLRPFASDGLPILGTVPEIENLFVATAHYRNGILLAPKTAEILADKIVGNAESKYLEIFSPRRFRRQITLS